MPRGPAEIMEERAKVHRAMEYLWGLRGFREPDLLRGQLVRLNATLEALDAELDGELVRMNGSCCPEERTDGAA